MNLAKLNDFSSSLKLKLEHPILKKSYSALLFAQQLFSLSLIFLPFYFIVLRVFLIVGFIRSIISNKSKEYFLNLAVVSIPATWGILIGFQGSNPGLISEIKLYLLAPIIYVTLFWNPPKETKRLLHKSMLVNAWLVIITWLLLFFLPADNFLFEWLSPKVVYFEQYFNGYRKVNHTLVTCVIFLLPYFFSMSILKFNLFNFITSAFLMNIAFFAGRKSIIYSIIIMSLIYGYLIFKEKVNLKRLYTIVLVPLLAMALVAGLTESKFEEEFKIVKYQGMVKSAFDSGETEEDIEEFDVTKSREFDFAGTVVRIRQAKVLISEISEAPFFGKGLGYVIKRLIRSEQFPWRYELSYFGICLNVGIIGFLIYLAWYLFYLIRNFKSKLSEHNDLLSFSVSSIFFLTCSLTNPYILSIKFFWIFFIPLLVNNLLKD